MGSCIWVIENLLRRIPDSLNVLYQMFGYNLNQDLTVSYCDVTDDPSKMWKRKMRRRVMRVVLGFPVAYASFGCLQNIVRYIVITKYVIS